MWHTISHEAQNHSLLTAKPAKDPLGIRLELGQPKTLNLQAEIQTFPVNQFISNLLSRFYWLKI